MRVATLSYGIPDIVLPRLGGGSINPCAFVGHELVFFFCPTDPGEAAKEIASYNGLLQGFEAGGAWVMGVLTGPEPAAEIDGIALARDPQGEAWAAFESLVDESDRRSELQGGSFLFGRGGGLIRAWAGSGHAEEMLAALRQRG